MTTIDSRITAIAQAITELTNSVRAGKPLSKEDAVALLECRTQFDILKQVDTFIEVKAGSKLMAICDKWELPPTCGVESIEAASDEDPVVYCAYVQGTNRPRLYWADNNERMTHDADKATFLTRTLARRVMDDLVLKQHLTGNFRNSTASEALDKVAGSVEVGILHKDGSPEVSTVLTPVVPQEM